MLVLPEIFLLGIKTPFIFTFQDGAVPRFYFDVREGTSFTPDEEGLEFDSLNAAEPEAATTAAEIGRDRLPKDDTARLRSRSGTNTASGC
jgi:hypothetical protein